MCRLSRYAIRSASPCRMSLVACTFQYLRPPSALPPGWVAAVDPAAVTTQGDIPADLVVESDDVIVFRDIAPKAPVHVGPRGKGVPLPSPLVEVHSIAVTEVYASFATELGS